jgi:hypothetical protein
MSKVAQDWLNEQLYRQRALLLIVDRLAEPDPLEELFKTNLVLDYVNLYQDTEFAELADVGPWLIELNAPDEAPLHSLLDNPQRHWGWLASAEHIDMATLGKHWRARMLIEENTQRSLFRFQDNRVMARSLSYMQEHEVPQLLGPLHSALCWNGEEWRSYDNPYPDQTAFNQPAPWLYPEPSTIQRETRLINLEQWLWEQQPEATCELARSCNVRDWLEESLALADEWGWLAAEQVAFLLAARRGSLLASSQWQPLPGETSTHHFARCRLAFA